MALTVRLAADVLARQYVTRTQLSVSVKPGVKEQLADRVSKQYVWLPAVVRENESPPPRQTLLREDLRTGTGPNRAAEIEPN